MGGRSSVPGDYDGDGMTGIFQPIECIDDQTYVPVIFARNHRDANEYRKAYDFGGQINQ